MIVRCRTSPNGAPTKNKFVHLALQRTLALGVELVSAGTLQNALGRGLDITIVGDNDFYSQRAQVTHCGLRGVQYTLILFCSLRHKTFRPRSRP